VVENRQEVSLAVCILIFMSARNAGHATAIIAEATVVLIAGPKKDRKLENAGEEKSEVTIQAQTNGPAFKT
jgi:hypothetical protein